MKNCDSRKMIEIFMGFKSKVVAVKYELNAAPLYLSNFFLMEEENTSGAIILTKGGAWSKKWSHEGWTSCGGGRLERRRPKVHYLCFYLAALMQHYVKNRKEVNGIQITFWSETFGIDFASFHDCHSKDARAKVRRNFCGAPSWGGEKGALSEGQRLYQVWGWVDLLDLKIWSF